ncbi:MAG: protein kinase [Deltaproteobacteria bacterium]|nr:protein kinase [Deltaproteobacteria bacterium]
MNQNLPRRFGPYVLLCAVTQGTRGSLYIALRHDNPGQLIAIKMLPQDLFSDLSRLDSLRAEASGLVRSFHGSVAQVLDLGECQGDLYMVLEFIAGKDLSHVTADMARAGARPPPGVCAFAAMQACSGLSFLGARGRPGWAATAMLSYEGEVKLVDLGATLAALVRAEGPRTAAIAPEVLRGQAYDLRADVYAAGAFLWQLCAGRLLFTGDAGGYVAGVAGGAPRPDLAAVAPGTPPGLVAAAMQALAPDPAARPPDCDALFYAIATSVPPEALHAAPEQLASFLGRLYGAERAAEREEIGHLARSAMEALRDTAQAPRQTTSFIIGAGPDTAAPVTKQTTGGVPERVADERDEGEDELPAGQVIPGTRYRILEKIGSGGMGAVYLAEHDDIERRVALKMLSPLLVGDAESLARFRFEARTASRIGHPNIVEITDFGEAPGSRYFFVMEYLQGETLGGVLRREGRVAPARAVGILRQVAKALGAAHSKGIVHCDVKPDNIILLSLKSQEERKGHRRRADFIKVLDFGIAAMLEKRGGEPEAGAAAFVAGTAEYMSPERAKGLTFDGRADIYSLGAVAYEMLTGDVPFHGQTLVQTLTAHLKDPVVPPAERTPDARIPHALSQWVLHSLAKDAGSRPQSCAELEAELCEAQVEAKLRTEWDHLELPDEIDPERRARLAARMPTAPKGRKWLWAAVVGFALLSLGLAAFILVQKPRFIFVNEESPAVRELLDQAAAAVAAGNITRPEGQSAHEFLERASAQAPKSARLKGLREGTARVLRGGADRLWEAGLRFAARDMYREALLFTPWDSSLKERAGAELPEEPAGSQPASGEAAGVAAGPGGARAAGKLRDVDWLATQASLAILEGRLTGPRSAAFYLQELRRVDPNGAAARRVARDLAPELRARAQRFWNAGAYDEARRLNGLVAAMDPADDEAQARASGAEQPGRPKPPLRPVVAATPQQDAGIPAVSSAAKEREQKEAKEKERLAAEEAKRKAREAAMLAPPEPEAKRDPETSRRLSKEGMTAYARGRLGDAEAQFQRALKSDAGNAEAVFGLAEVYFERARYTEALDVARRAARMSPKSARVHVLCGDAYYKLLRYQDALNSWRKALGLKPGDASIQRRIDNLEKKAGK